MGGVRCLGQSPKKNLDDLPESMWRVGYIPFFVTGRVKALVILDITNTSDEL